MNNDMKTEMNSKSNIKFKKTNKKNDDDLELIIEDITDTAPDLKTEEAVGSSAPKAGKKKKKKKKSETKESAPEKEAEVAKDKPQEAEVAKDKSREAEKPEKTVEKADESDAEDDSDKEGILTDSLDASKPAGYPDTEVGVSDIVIDMHGIIKRYFIGQPNELEVLHGIDMKVRRGEFVAVVGQSGSGKSTLMNMIGALDRPTEGQYFLDGVDMFAAKDKDLSAIRCKKIGFVFQTYNLVARTSALKNVELPMLYAGMSMTQRSRRAKDLLAMVEMEDRMRHQPDELSGGQKQRVAIARAMANDPAIILADEPTGALDSQTGRLIMDIFHRLHDEQGKTIILITHSPELAEECERILTLKDGNIINERKGSGKVAVL